MTTNVKNNEQKSKSEEGKKRPQITPELAEKWGPPFTDPNHPQRQPPPNDNGHARSANNDPGAAAHAQGVSSFEILERLNRVKIDLNEKLEPPQSAIIQRVGDEVRTVFTLGNISGITGKAKSRKSFAVGIGVAAAIGGNGLPGQLEGALPPGQNKVIYFDTEQAKYHVQLTAKRIASMAANGGNIDNLSIYALREFKQADRAAIVKYAIENTPNLGLVIIDGIRDLIRSINDEDQATEIMDDLLTWSAQKNIHILSVLHQNKGNEQVRGWIGSELLNKAETIISVKIESEDRNISTVSPEQTRGKAFEQFSFEIDNGQKYGIPVQAENVKSRVIDDKKFTVDHLTTEQFFEITKRIFKRRDTLNASEIKEEIKYALSKMDTKSKGKHLANAIKTVLVNEGYVDEEREGRTKIYTPIIPEQVYEQTEAKFD
jgi:hypothetical protein